jgi:primosomal protein N' (replication factor Y)
VSTLSVCDVALDPRKGGSEAVWTYRREPGIAVGDAVIVPLGTRTELGYVLRIYDTTEADLGFPLKTLRNVLSRVSGLSLPDRLVKLVLFTAQEYLCSEAVALSPAIPPGVKDRLLTEWEIADQEKATRETNPVLQEVLRVMSEAGGTFQSSKGKSLSPAVTKALGTLTKKGTVAKQLRVVTPEQRGRAEQLYQLSSNTKAVEKFLLKDGRKKPAQAVTLMQLQGSVQGALTISEIKILAAVTEASIKALVQLGLIEAVPTGQDGTRRTPPEPNPAQRVAIDAISEAVRAKRFQSFLLFGVTGSGKTEVYLRSANEALRAGRSVLYVVPEIALAAQTIGLLRERFGAGVTILHSNLSPTERLTNWLKVRDGSVNIVLGARSALFAPISNLGLVILDEEHEQAYKQEASPRYHAKRVALELARLHRCPIVLGSATPSVETFFEAEQQELVSSKAAPVGPTLLSLPERTANSKLPTVTVRDLGEGYRNRAPAILTDDLQELVKKSVEDGRQVILFLNRRAYAPFVLCRDCGKTQECPNCSVSLSFHRHEGQLRCHHCGYHTRPPEACPKCGSHRLSPFGAGTERVEEAIREAFPGVSISRLDRDIARKKGALEQILAGFRSGEISILVGTQMIAKGLDFPNVTLVGVIAADVSLNIPDFRACERTFQLLSQVAGRAGRGSAPGSVIIQTFNPEHASIVAAKTHDYLPFYELMKLERLEVGYPPFKRLVNILLSGQDQEAVLEATEEAATRIRRRCPEVEVLGPVDCAVARIFGKWRRHVLVKLNVGAPAKPIADALLGFEPPDVLIVIDVDPYSMI